MADENTLTDEQLVATVNDALAILAEVPEDGTAFSRVAFKDPAVGTQIVLLATVKALTLAAPESIAQAILFGAGLFAEEFAEQYERFTGVTDGNDFDATADEDPPVAAV